MSRFLFDKEVDQSLLKAGLTVPVNMHEKIQDAVGVRLFEEGKIHVYCDKKIRAEYDIQDFSHSPNAVFRNIQKSIADTTRTGQ